MILTRVKSALALSAVFIVCMATLDAQNRFYFPSQEIRGLASNQEVFIHVDNDVDLLGLSFALTFDRAKVRIVGMESAGVAVSPAFESGVLDSVTGQIVYGLAFDLDFSDGPDNVLAAGKDQRVLRIVVDTLVDTRTSALFDFQDGLGSTDARNRMANTVGDSFSPALEDGFVTIDPFRPIINNITGNSGTLGDEFLIVGRHFEKPGFEVRVCGHSATANVDPDGFVATVTAPGCSSIGWANVEVCNDFGCVQESEGFSYTSVSEALFLRGDLDRNMVAELTDAILLVRYLFLGVDFASCEDAADINDDGDLDIVDPLQLLFFLFDGGTVPSPPFPDPGSDPTVDDLGFCF